MSASSTRPGMFDQPGSNGARTMNATASAPTTPKLKRSTVMSRGLTLAVTIRPSTVPDAHRTAAPTANNADCKAAILTSNGCANVISHAPTSAGTA